MLKFYFFIRLREHNKTAADRDPAGNSLRGKQ